MHYRSISVDRTLVTFEPKADRLVAIDGSARSVQIIKIYVDGISKNSHMQDKNSMETFFIPVESISPSWTGGADLSCKLESTSTNGGDETCIDASVSNFDKCEWCKNGLVQLSLSSPFTGKYRIELMFKNIGAAGTVKAESWSQLLLPDFEYEGINDR